MQQTSCRIKEIMGISVFHFCSIGIGILFLLCGSLFAALLYIPLILDMVLHLCPKLLYNDEREREREREKEREREGG